MEHLHDIDELHQLDREIGDELHQLESIRSLKESDIVRVEIQDCQNRIFKLSQSVESLVQDVNSVAMASQKQVSRGLAQMARCVDMVQQSVQNEAAKRQEEINNLSLNVSDMIAQSGAKLREEITALSVELSTVRTERATPRDHTSPTNSTNRSLNSASGYVEAFRVAKLREEMTALSMELLAVRNDVSIEIEAACLAKLREDMTAVNARSLREDLTALSTEVAAMRSENAAEVEASHLATAREERAEQSPHSPSGGIETRLGILRDEISVMTTEMSRARSTCSEDLRSEMKELIEVVAREEILRSEADEQIGNELKEVLRYAEVKTLLRSESDEQMGNQLKDLLEVVAKEKVLRTENSESIRHEVQELGDLIAGLQETCDLHLQEQDCNELIDLKQTKTMQDIAALQQYATFSEEMQAELLREVNTVRNRQGHLDKDIENRLEIVNDGVDAKTNEMQACCSALGSDVAKMSQAFLKLTQKFSALTTEKTASRQTEAESVTDAFLRGKVDSSVLMNSDIWMKRTEASLGDSSTAGSDGFSRASRDDDKEPQLNIESFSFSPRQPMRLDLRSVSRVASRQTVPAVNRPSIPASRYSSQCTDSSARSDSRDARRSSTTSLQSPRQTMRLTAREVPAAVPASPINGVREPFLHKKGEATAARSSKERSDPLELISRLNALKESMHRTVTPRGSITPG